MIIGNFKYDQAKDTYTGEIETLTLLRGKVHFRPAESKSEKGPALPRGGRRPTPVRSNSAQLGNAYSPPS